MTRAFNLEVFNQTINGDGTTPPTYYTAMDYAATLGSADSLNAHLIVEGLTDSAGIVTVTYQRSNTTNTEDFKSISTSATVTPGGTDGSKVPKGEFYAITAASDLGAYGRFRITYDKSSMVTVRIVVCGRTN